MIVINDVFKEYINVKVLHSPETLRISKVFVNLPLGTGGHYLRSIFKFNLELVCVSRNNYESMPTTYELNLNYSSFQRGKIFDPLFVTNLSKVYCR
jgi:hypothetical protein